MTWGDVTALAKLTLRDPQAGARAVLALPVPREHNFTLFLLVIVLSGILAEISLILLPSAPPEGAADGVAGTGPILNGFAVTALIGGAILLMAGAITGIGRMFGGTGTMTDVLRLVIWQQFLLLALQAVQILLALILPALAALVTLVGVGLSLWLLTHFVTVAHGFASPAKVFLGLLASSFAIALLISLALTALVVPVPSGA